MSAGECIPRPRRLTPFEIALLAKVRIQIGERDFDGHKAEWEYKVRQDSRVLQHALERLQARPAIPPLRSKGAWLSNTYHRLREDAVMQRRAQQ